MKRFDLGDRRPILFTTVDFDCACLAQLDRNDPRRRIGAEEHRVLLKFHRRSREPEKQIRKAGKEETESGKLENHEGFLILSPGFLASWFMSLRFLL